jgi:hypothetical protein
MIRFQRDDALFLLVLCMYSDMLRFVSLEL